MTSALAYLAVCSMRNGIRVRLRRLRQPRYLFIGLALVLYFGMMIFNRSVNGAWTVPARYERHAVVGAAFAFFALMALGWVIQASAGLRFTLADVNFLFPAPLARRQLLGYKLARLVLGACGSATFITLVLGPPQWLAAGRFAGKTFLIMAVLGVHEAGVSLYRTNRKESGRLSVRLLLPVLLSAAALMALAAWALARFAFAGSTGEYLRFTPVVVLLLAANVAWVLGSDAAFEEDASLNAEKVRATAVQFRKGRARLSAKRTTPFRLAPTGPVETAILWKNWLLFGRTSRAWIVSAGLGLLVFGASFVAAGRSSEPRGEMVSLLTLVVAGLIVMFGPIMMRMDLRQDLANLVVFKTWPVSGAAIIRGEVLAPALALSLATTAFLVIGGVLAPASLLSTVASALGRLSFIVSTTLVASAFVVTQLVVQNGIAVTFPAWVRITPGSGTSGVEAMGQMLVVMYGGLFVALLAALLPGAVAAGLMFALDGTLLPALAFASLLLVESFAATEILGRILDRTDLQDVVVQ